MSENGHKNDFYQYPPPYALKYTRPLLTRDCEKVSTDPASSIAAIKHFVCELRYPDLNSSCIKVKPSR